MKKLGLCVLVVLCYFFVFSSVSSAETVYSLHVEWGYTPPSAPAVTGFKLYKEGVFVVEWTGASISAGDVVCLLTAQVTNFTLTAAFNDGTESPHSAPFAFSLASARPATPADFKLLSERGVKFGPGTRVMVASIYMGAKG